MNKLDNIVADNIKNNYQCNETIYYEPKFDNKFSLSCGPTIDSLLVVTEIHIGGNKNRETIIPVLTWLWDSGATDTMIKRQHAKTY